MASGRTSAARVIREVRSFCRVFTMPESFSRGLISERRSFFPWSYETTLKSYEGAQKRCSYQLIRLFVTEFAGISMSAAAFQEERARLGVLTLAVTALTRVVRHSGTG